MYSNYCYDGNSGTFSLLLFSYDNENYKNKRKAVHILGELSKWSLMLKRHMENWKYKLKEERTKIKFKDSCWLSCQKLQDIFSKSQRWLKSNKLAKKDYKRQNVKTC